jgi:chromosomal replication initiator protein
MKPIFLSPEVIIDAVAGHFKIPPCQLANCSRKRDVTKARHISMYLIRIFTGYTYYSIGRYFDRDHSSVINAEKSVTDQSELYKSYRDELNTIFEELLDIKESEFAKYKQYNTDVV